MRIYVKTEEFNFILRMVSIFLFSFLMILASHIKIPLFFTPVPVTLQTLVVFLSIFFLRKRAFFSQLFWISLGIFNLPIFANGGGLSYLVGPTAGYIWGFVSAPLLFSSLFDKLEKTKRITFFTLFGCYFLINVWIYIMGVTWFKMSINISWTNTILLGVFPFIGGDIAKIILATFISLSYIKSKKL